MVEPITAAKFFGGLLQGKTWLKSIALGFCVLCLTGVGFSLYTTYKVYTKPTQVQNSKEGITNVTNQYDIRPLLGGCATIKDYTKK